MIDRIAGYNDFMKILDYKNNIESNDKNERKARTVTSVDTFIGDKRESDLNKSGIRGNLKNSGNKNKSFEEILKAACEKLARK